VKIACIYDAPSPRLAPLNKKKLEEYFGKTKVWEPWLVVASSVLGYTQHSGHVQTACHFCLVTTIMSTKSGMVDSQSNYVAFSNHS